MTMPRHSYFLALLLLLSPTVNSARETPELGSPAFTTVPELSAGFDLLYEQRFAEAREVFARNRRQSGFATHGAFPRSAGSGPAASPRSPPWQSPRRRGSVCADAGRRHGIGRLVDFGKEASRSLEAHEGG